jgi:hypothetical protein
MSPATRIRRPSRGIALLLAGLALAALFVAGSRMTAHESTSAGPGVAVTTAVEMEAASAATALDGVADHAQRQIPRQPLAGPTSLVVAILAMAAAVATGLRYTISSVPDAGRATSGLRPPPLLLRA